MSETYSQIVLLLKRDGIDFNHRHLNPKEKAITLAKLLNKKKYFENNLVD